MLGGADGEFQQTILPAATESSLPGTAVIGFFQPLWSWSENRTESLVLLQDKWNGLLFIYYL